MNVYSYSNELEWLRVFCSGEVNGFQILEELSRRHRAKAPISIFLGLKPNELGQVATFVSRDDIPGAIAFTESRMLKRIGTLQDLESYLARRARQAYWLLVFGKLAVWFLFLLALIALYAAIVYRYIDQKYFWHPNRQVGWVQELSKFWLVSDFLRGLFLLEHS
jgi:hypothetical protein